MALDPESLDKEQVRRLIKDCLDKKGMDYKDLAAAVGMMFPKKGKEPKPQAAHTIFNAFSPAAIPLTLRRVSKWCAVLGYPLDDLLAGYEYVDPKSHEALRRDFERALKRIEDLEAEVRKLKEAAGQVTT